MWLPTSSGEPPKLESLSLQPHLGGTRSERRCTRKSVYNQETRELLKSGGPRVLTAAIRLDSELLTHLSFSRFSSGSSAMGGLRCTEIRGRSIRCNRVGDAVLEAERSTPFFRSL